MNKTILLIVPVLALLTTVTILQQQKANATPVITNFGNGYADGKHAAQQTFHSGGYRDARLSSIFLEQCIVLLSISHRLRHDMG